MSCDLPAGGAHRPAAGGAGQGARGEKLLPAGAGQDSGVLGNLQEAPGGGAGGAEEPREGGGGGGGAAPGGDHGEPPILEKVLKVVNCV